MCAEGGERGRRHCQDEVSQSHAARVRRGERGGKTSRLGLRALPEEKDKAGDSPRRAWEPLIRKHMRVSSEPLPALWFGEKRKPLPSYADSRLLFVSSVPGCLGGEEPRLNESSRPCPPFQSNGTDIHACSPEATCQPASIALGLIIAWFKHARESSEDDFVAERLCPGSPPWHGEGDSACTMSLNGAL